MKVYNISKTTRYIDKSWPTVIRWIEQKRMKPDMYTPTGKPLFLETTLDDIKKEIEEKGTPSVKEEDEEPIPA